MEILRKIKSYLRAKLYVCFFLLISSSFFSQKLSDYYLTTKIVSFKDPIIVVPDYDKVGIFIVESEDFNKEKNLKSLFKQKKAFFFDKEVFFYEVNNNVKDLNSKEEDYDYVIRKEINNSIILKLNEKIKSFYVGFIRVEYYNYINTTADKRAPYIKNTEDYVPILIPSIKGL
ncbi:hypothetical protein [Chryseobacterium sp.]|uniref:hypothetical protein n=1 Tax=Chryseobacterium sp. TaxID=1871047 RepID=UPI0024E247DB|nr:hypothetical protein [Chryseobacterium sp.]